MICLGIIVHYWDNYLILLYHKCTKNVDIMCIFCVVSSMYIHSLTSHCVNSRSYGSMANVKEGCGTSISQSPLYTRTWSCSNAVRPRGWRMQWTYGSGSRLRSPQKEQRMRLSGLANSTSFIGRHSRSGPKGRNDKISSPTIWRNWRNASHNWMKYCKNMIHTRLQMIILHGKLCWRNLER